MMILNFQRAAGQRVLELRQLPADALDLEPVPVVARYPRDIAFEVAVDDIDGTVRRALSPKPNSAYLLDLAAGTIRYRALGQ